MSATKERENVDELVDEFHDLVNMTATELDHWLKTDESREVGQHTEGNKEAVGHHSGREIVDLLHGKKRRDYSDAEISQMKRTVSYVKRHLAQRPKGETSGTRWSASLKNWGHDPEKKKRS